MAVADGVSDPDITELSYKLNFYLINMSLCTLGKYTNTTYDTSNITHITKKV